MQGSSAKKTRIPVLKPVYKNTEEQGNVAPVNKEQLPAKVALPTFEGIEFQAVEQIISLEADGNYTLIHLSDGKPILICKTLRDTEAILHRRSFVRVHRSFTINMAHIARYVRGKGGYIVMDNGSVVNVSTGRKQEFLDAIQEFYG